MPFERLSEVLAIGNPPGVSDEALSDMKLSIMNGVAKKCAFILSWFLRMGYQPSLEEEDPLVGEARALLGPDDVEKKEERVQKLTPEEQALVDFMNQHCQSIIGKLAKKDLVIKNGKIIVNE